MQADSISISQPFKKKMYVALLYTHFYMLEKTHFRIVALKHSKAAPTLDVLFSRFNVLDN